ERCSQVYLFPLENDFVVRNGKLSHDWWRRKPRTLGGITTGDAFTYLKAVIGHLSRQERQV
ncbi:unnamed protein product, partial [Brassica oleracea var. botrytis]